MKTVMMFLSSALLLCGLSGVASATTWTDLVNIGVTLEGTGSYSWSHELPGGDFSAPPDTVNSASLAITARRATESNDLIYYYVELDDDYLGFLMAGSGNSEQVTTFDLGSLFLNAIWNSGDVLSFRLDYSQPTGSNNRMTLERSLFTLDYTSGTVVGGDNGGPTAAPVPEPSTVVLLGSGLLGLFYVARRRSKQ